MIDMVGIGPFVVMPLVVSNFQNGLFIWAWIFGAVTALIDGMIWSELGAKYPLAGGTYNFHRIAFGEKGGRLMSFLLCGKQVFRRHWLWLLLPLVLPST
jgi:amino acid transporter